MIKIVEAEKLLSYKVLIIRSKSALNLIAEFKY